MWRFRKSESKSRSPEPEICRNSSTWRSTSLNKLFQSPVWLHMRSTSTKLKMDPSRTPTIRPSMRKMQFPAKPFPWSSKTSPTSALRTTTLMSPVSSKTMKLKLSIGSLRKWVLSLKSSSNPPVLSWCRRFSCLPFGPSSRNLWTAPTQCSFTSLKVYKLVSL